MKKVTKNIFLFVLLGIFLVSFMSSFVGAEVEFRDAGGNLLLTISEGVQSAAESVGLSGNEIISRWLLTGLLIMLVYAIVSKLPFLNGTSDGAKVLRWGVSIVVGILGFIFVDGQEIQTILTNYQALGVALTSLLPLVILVTFFVELRDSGNPKMMAVAGVIEKPLFVLFGVYLAIKWSVLAYEGSSLAWIYILTLIIVVIWLLFGNAIYRRFEKFREKVNRKIVGEKVQKSVRMVSINAAQYDALSGNEQSTFKEGGGIIAS